jgi:hypothetical protein
MRYIKEYKDIDGDYKIGDFVIIKTPSIYDEFVNFINNNVGVIISIKPIYSNHNGVYLNNNIDVMYLNVPVILQGRFRKTIEGYVLYGISDYDIVNFSDKKEDLEDIIVSKKYNL